MLQDGQRSFKLRALLDAVPSSFWFPWRWTAGNVGEACSDMFGYFFLSYHISRCNRNWRGVAVLGSNSAVSWPLRLTRMPEGLEDSL